MSDQNFKGPVRAATGIEGLDYILGGGFPINRMYLLEGDPGAGKTTMALQFLLEGARNGEPGVYATLSETEEELRDVAASHGWSLDGVTICELQTAEESLKADSQYTLFHPSEVELSETTRAVLDTVERVKPLRVVFDSLSEMRLLARDSLRYRRQILALKHYFTGQNCTVLLLDYTGATTGDFQLQSLTHGVIAFEQIAPGYGGQRRRVRVQKVRGVAFRDGYHDYRITTGGLGGLSAPGGRRACGTPDGSPFLANGERAAGAGRHAGRRGHRPGEQRDAPGAGRGRQVDPDGAIHLGGRRTAGSAPRSTPSTSRRPPGWPAPSGWASTSTATSRRGGSPSAGWTRPSSRRASSPTTSGWRWRRAPGSW